MPLYHDSLKPIKSIDSKMEVHYARMIETLIVVVTYVVIRMIVTKVVSNVLTGRLIQESRGMHIRKLINAIMLAIGVIFISLIWGVNQSRLLVFLGSVLTVIGVAFFAQWSLISNITSSIIIFFNHPVTIHDTRKLMERKDYEIEGRVVNIGLFFITLATKDGDEVTLPNNVFCLKVIKQVNSQTQFDRTQVEGESLLQIESVS